MSKVELLHEVKNDGNDLHDMGNRYILVNFIHDVILQHQLAYITL